MNAVLEYKQRLPEYYEYYMMPLKIVESPHGALRAYKLSPVTGKFEVVNSKLRKVFFAMGEEITRVDVEEFIKITEENRADCLRGEGPIFTLYRAIDDLYAQLKLFDSASWRVVYEAIRTIRHRTFEMWEEEFARQDAGEPPSFTYEPVGGSAAVEKLGQVDPTPDLTPEEAAEWFRELGPIRANFSQAWNEALANDQP